MSNSKVWVQNPQPASPLGHNARAPWSPQGPWCLPTSPLLPTHSDHTISASIHCHRPGNHTCTIFALAWSPIPSSFSSLPIATHCIHLTPSGVLWSLLQSLVPGLAIIYLVLSPCSSKAGSVLPISVSTVFRKVPGANRDSVKRQNDAPASNLAIAIYTGMAHSCPPGNSTSRHAPARNSHLCCLQAAYNCKAQMKS